MPDGFAYRIWFHPDAVDSALAAWSESEASLLPASPAAPAIRQHFGVSAQALADAECLVARVPRRSDDAARDQVMRFSLLVSALAGIDGCVAVGWNDAQSAMAPDYFRTIVARWSDGGPFPALGLVTLAEESEGMVTLGLETLIGQELTVSSDAGADALTRAKLATRVIDHLVEAGPVKSGQEIEIHEYGHFFLTPDRRGEKIYLTRSPFP